MRHDARRSFRIQLPEPQQRGIFLLGKQRFPVLMLNASAVGFAFLSPKPIGVAIGTVARLQADDAWYEVLIVRTEQTEEGLLIGVERLADIKDPNGFSAGPNWSRTNSSDPGSTASTALVVAGVALCAVLSAYLIAGRATLDALRHILGQTTSAQMPASSLVGETASEGGASATVSLMRFVGNAPERRTARDSASIAARQRLLLADETVPELRLTAAQKREISRVLQPREATPGLDGDAWEQARLAESRILQILSPKQIAAWRAIELP